MSINKVVLLGKLISKKYSNDAARAVIETTEYFKTKQESHKNFVVCFGDKADSFSRIAIGNEVYIEGKLNKNESNVTEVVIRHFEVPNMEQN